MKCSLKPEVAKLVRAEVREVLRWVLEKRGEDWRLVDLVQVETQRTSFARVLDEGGADRLFLRRERRREELLAEVTP